MAAYLCLQDFRVEATERPDGLGIRKRKDGSPMLGKTYREGQVYTDVPDDHLRHPEFWQSMPHYEGPSND